MRSFGIAFSLKVSKTITMGKVKTTAVRSLDYQILYYEESKIVASKPEIVVKLLGRKVTEIQINCFFLPTYAEKIERWKIYSEHIELREGFNELRLRLCGDGDLNDILTKKIAENPDVHPVDVMLNIKNWKGNLIFTDLGNYSCDFAVVMISKWQRKKLPWPRWEWYIPDDSLT